MLELGGIAQLTVKEVGKIGAFLDWGLEKDLLLPFKEQTKRVRENDQVLVALYIDKSSRLCATMKIYPYLCKESSYKKDDHVTGIVYEISKTFGAFVAVDGKYSGLIQAKEAGERYHAGDVVQPVSYTHLNQSRLNSGKIWRQHIRMRQELKSQL